MTVPLAHKSHSRMYPREGERLGLETTARDDSAEVFNWVRERPAFAEQPTRA